MAALALADVLKDFGGPQRPAKPGPMADALRQPSPISVEPAQPQEPSILEKAVAEALLEQKTQLEAEHAAEIEALKENHGQEIARIQAEIGDRSGAIVAAGFEAMEERLQTLTSSVAARILGIALTEDVQARALDALAKSIKDAARDREAVRIRISGPLSLFEALQPMLGRHAEQVEFSESAGLDITASIDDALFETRLSEWSASLSEILA
jgi:hypothetical protein